MLKPTVIVLVLIDVFLYQVHAANEIKLQRYKTVIPNASLGSDIYLTKINGKCKILGSLYGEQSKQTIDISFKGKVIQNAKIVNFFYAMPVYIDPDVTIAKEEHVYYADDVGTDKYIQNLFAKLYAETSKKNRGICNR